MSDLSVNNLLGIKGLKKSDIDLIFSQADFLFGTVYASGEKSARFTELPLPGDWWKLRLFAAELA